MIILHEIDYTNGSRVQAALGKAHQILNDPNSSAFDISRAKKTLENIKQKQNNPSKKIMRTYYGGSTLNSNRNVDLIHQRDAFTPQVKIQGRIHGGKRRGQASGTGAVVTDYSRIIHTDHPEEVGTDVIHKVLNAKKERYRDAGLKDLEELKKKVTKPTKSEVEAPKSNSVPPVANANSSRKSIDKTEILQKRKGLLKSNSNNVKQNSKNINVNQNPKNIAKPNVSLPVKSSSGSWFGRNKGKLALGVGLGAAAAYGIHKYRQNKKKKEEEKNLM